MLVCNTAPLCLPFHLRIEHCVQVCAGAFLFLSFCTLVQPGAGQHLKRSPISQRLRLALQPRQGKQMLLQTDVLAHQPSREWARASQPTALPARDNTSHC